MKARLPIATIFVLVLGCPWTAQGYVTFGPLADNDVRHQPYWSKGLKETVTSQPRVAGDFFDAPTFGAGMMTINLYYEGDQGKLNDLIDRLARVEGNELVLILDPKKGVYGKNPRTPVRVKKHTPFDWQVTISTNGLLARGRGEFKDGPKTRVWLRYYLGDRGHLMGLEVPAKLKVRAGFDAKYREAHASDPTVQAIDSYLVLRKKQLARSSD